MSDVSSFSTPMMVQYLELKQQYPDCILWFRLGDFYEMFLEHAEIGSKVLGITLTSRARGKDGRIPMAGVPYHAADAYLGKLVNAGYKVAICEQVSEPNGRTLVDRKVVRIVTPGTILDQKTLTDKNNNYVLSLCHHRQTLGVAAVDLSTGECNVGEVPFSVSLIESTLSELLMQFSSKELLICPELASVPTVIQSIQKLDVSYVISEDWDKWIKTKSMSSFVTPLQLKNDSPAVKAAHALHRYLEHTQQATIKHLQLPQPLFPDSYVAIDRSTITNLELFETLHHQQKSGSLLAIIDHTQTAMGGRLLKQWLLKPLAKKPAIDQRLSLVSVLVNDQPRRAQIRHSLSQIHDIERLLARLSVGLGNPRELRNIATSFQVGLTMIENLKETSFRTLIDKSKIELKKVQEIIELIDAQLEELPPIDTKIGGIFKPGVYPELDRLRKVKNSSQQIVAELESKERQRTGIPSLKIKFNQVFGFYIEVSKSNLESVPDDYFRKQTLVNAERFITPELKEQEDIILSADEKIQKLEIELFQKLVKEVITYVASIHAISHVISQVDCLQSLAETAEMYSFSQPSISKSGEIRLLQSRHPVVEQLIENRAFVPNDIYLNQDSHQIILLTGPNMAGKSVLMRQVALIVLLAHVGSFVPAQSAEISLVDRIFVRSGASDMITAGLSTFMVEMVETAYILKHATEKSLIIMDEIGRGTSTFDGIGLAWAIAEHLVQNRTKGPKTLFATHYHELQELSEQHPDRIHNYHMSVTEHKQKPIFLYTLTKGGASHSYGVAVAELAGLPESVISKAKTILSDMEHHAWKQKSNT